MEKIDTENVHIMLKDMFPFTEAYTQYIAVFRTLNRRELALERDRTEAFYIWLERYDQDIPGVTINNVKHPGQSYGPKQTRNSTLNHKNAPRLKIGNRVWYLEISS